MDRFESVRQAKVDLIPARNAVMTAWSSPNENNFYLQQHVACLLQSWTHWTGRSLIDPGLPRADQARQLFDAPFVVLSHDTAPDPILNYANRAALALFELSWEELIVLPSRLTAEFGEQSDRAQLLETVTRQGYIDNYRGVRVAKSRRRFLIERASVWNLLDDQGAYYGQAATFSQWRFLDP